MPELPEAEAVTRRLRKQALGATIAWAHVERKLSIGDQTPDMIMSRTLFARILTVERRAKQILIDLSTGYTIRVHLGMTGDLYKIPDCRLRPLTARVWLELATGEAIVFDDPRVFGRFNVYTHPELDIVMDGLGVEPLSNSFTAGHLAKLVQNSKLPVKVFLMDQTKVAGLGNIYAAEALFRAGIHPARKAGSLRPIRIERLRDAIVSVLKEAVRSAAIAYSKPGRFREGEAFQPDVYGREGERCNRCGRKIRRIVQAGRSTYFCPGCQT